MNNKELALAYIKTFCAADIGAMEPLLTPDLRFAGPYHRFVSRASYLESLVIDPPEISNYIVLATTTGDKSVSVFWDYVKPAKTLTVAQLFRMNARRISEILLVFDTVGFAQTAFTPDARQPGDS